MYWSDKGNGDFEQPQEGNTVGICSWIIDLGTQAGSYEGKPTSAAKTLVAWELGQKMKNGKPFRVIKYYTQSLHENANLRKDLEAWRGRQFTEDEKKRFDPRNLLGKVALLLLMKDKKEKVRIKSVSKVPGGMPVPAVIEDKIYFSLQGYTQEDYKALPGWIQEIIAKSPEYQALADFSPALGTKADEEEEAPAEQEEVAF